LANTTAIALRNARVLQTLRDASAHDTEARLKAERQVRSFKRYADFFESAADGMVVADHEGKVLFANPRARTILGFTNQTASPQIRELLRTDEWRKVSRLVRGFRQGVFPQGVDIRARNEAGEQRILSVNFSSVLHAEHAVLFTFRDVTDQRRTEVELRHTKEFLERMINSSVDAIVSVDMNGKVVLFNDAAARIFGYRGEDVLHTMDVRELYPPGGAKDVMRKIRSPEYGGTDRLEGYRTDMVDSRGRRVPVKISASLISDGEKAVGSVGIFTDVREALRMEAELMKAQEDLREQEKGAAVAHLAGATAHELDQPLTSVIGYAELLQHKLDSDSPLYKAAHVILLESARMADIVKKIGRITKYETKSYVGGAQILDLDKATDEPVEPRI
jgi:PAS domain S-box-containing protein